MAPAPAQPSTIKDLGPCVALAGRLLLQTVYRGRLVLGVALALAIVAIGRQGSFVAGGADSYGYISEAALWLDGNLHLRQDVMLRAPWPRAAETFSPLGYTPSPGGVHIVPVHAPGLPLFMAGAELVAGLCAKFWVVPLLGGILILATYAIGARIGRPMLGLAAAWLVATSPAVLIALANPMSDLPAAAAWALAVACVLGESRGYAFAAGLAAAVGILIRPNLVPMVGPFVLFTLHRDYAARPRAFVRMLTPWFVAAVSLGIVIEGAVNNSLYGSPFTSGYGSLDYSVEHVWPNLRAHVHWLSATQTPLVLVGLASLVVPLRRIWTTAAARRVLWFFVLYVASVWVPFLFFSVNEAWWYLRYLLPMWPVLMIGSAACLAAVYRTGWWPARLVAIAVLVAVVWYGWSESGRRGAFDVRAGEQKYIDAAEIVAGRTPPESAVLSVQHSGSVRYYAGRMTLRWDAFPRGGLDQALEWLSARGHPPYLLVEPWEVDLFRERYAESDAVGRLDWAPVVALHAASTVYLYDLTDRTRQDRETATMSTKQLPPRDQCVTPARPLPFDW